MTSAWYGREPLELAPELPALLDADPAARARFDASPAGYRRTVTHWVMSAQRAATRERRMRQLIQDSAAGLKVKPLR